MGKLLCQLKPPPMPTALESLNLVKSRLLGRNTLSSTIIGIVPRESNDEADDLSSAHLIGTAAVVVQVTGTNWPRPSYTLLATGLCRFHIDDFLQESPYAVARVTQLDKLTEDEDDDLNTDAELAALAENFREQAAKLVGMLDISIPVVAKLKSMLDSVPSQHLPDLCTSIVKASRAEKIQVLDAVNLRERFQKTLPLLMRQIEGLKLLQKAKKNRLEIVSQQPRKGRMRRIRTLRSISDEDDEEEADEMEELRSRIKDAQLPPHAYQAAMKEWKRLSKMPPQMPEHAMIRSYLELTVELPWSKASQDSIDIRQARVDLDEDHYGLDKVKKRIVEYLAVRQLKNSLKGPILCFVGPPGVGKTSIGRSIASTLGREFHRIALGGVCDQSDIRGHRRTYIGSMPGRIIQGLRLVGVNNPVFLLDEIDKLVPTGQNLTTRSIIIELMNVNVKLLYYGKTAYVHWIQPNTELGHLWKTDRAWRMRLVFHGCSSETTSLHGDPAAALLEVLDPEQNSTFTDHYLNVPFDLSQVLFIATANSMSTIPLALLDRMELIPLPGYTQEERVAIAMRHLVPKQLREHGLTADQLTIPEGSVKLIVSKYTREAGVRSLERRIGAICRAVAVTVAENKLQIRDGQTKAGITTKKLKTIKSAKNVVLETDPKMTDAKDHVEEVARMALPPELPIVIDEAAVEDILGPHQYDSEVSMRLSQPGVAIGLAWTVMGGEILYVEAMRMDGDGKLTLTGQLGDVMKESANLALNWVRSHATQLGLQQKRALLEKTDIHIHFPAGAVGKDGPSAGVTIVTVLVSLFTDRCVRSDTAMTGEVTLRGLILPVGGIKEKVMAAHRAGIHRIILPKRNEKDIHEVSKNVQNELSFIFASRLEDVLNAAFDDGFPELSMAAALAPSKL